MDKSAIEKLELNKTKVNKLIRFVISCIFDKKTIRRDKLKEKLGINDTNELEVTLDLAQKYLADVFGFMLVDVKHFDESDDPFEVLPSDIQNDDEKVYVPGQKLAKFPPLSETLNVNSSWICVNTMDHMLSMLEIDDNNKTFYAMLFYALGLIASNNGEIERVHLTNTLQGIWNDDKEVSPVYVDKEQFVIEAVRKNYLTRIESYQNEEISYKWGIRAKLEFPPDSFLEIVKIIWPELSEKSLHQIKVTVYTKTGADKTKKDV